MKLPEKQDEYDAQLAAKMENDRSYVPPPEALCWTERVARARTLDNFTSGDRELVGWYCTCAIGEQAAKMGQRGRDGLDFETEDGSEAGMAFYHAVNYGNVAEAEALLAQIQAHFAKP